jgi:pyruvate dehydrogenase E2 component (dihydrolipoamide acetyltransferase)
VADVIMPALGVAQDKGTLMVWLKQEGEQVEKGEPLMEIETDKATVEVEAPASGILANVTARAGDEVPVGEVIAQIVAPGEAAPPARERARGNLSDAPDPPSSASASSASTASAEASVSGAASASAATSTLSPASPKARRLAEERGVDLAPLTGSGPEGAVLAADLDAVASAQPATPAAEPAAPSRAWRVMAERMVQSWTTAPHFFLIRDVDASRLLSWRQALAARGVEATVSDLLVKLAAAALKEHPRVNSASADVNVGLAVATEEALVVPVVHGADRLSVAAIGERRREVVGRARAGKLRPADLEGGTFTISNLGMYGVDAFMAVLNPPQAAILAVGRIAERVIPSGGAAVIRPMLTLTLSGDHRAVDGARAAEFLQALAALIEEPASLTN